ncbi:hypothetical protein Bwad006_02800 [Bilophila wadsworthia]
MNTSINIKKQRGRITEINMAGSAANNFFKGLMKAQEEINGKTCETRSEHPGGDDFGRSGRDAGADCGEEAGTCAP